MPGTLFVVATPIGNLEDISARALGVLRRVSVIAAEDTRRTAKLLGHYGIPTPTTSLHGHNERQRLPSLIGRLAAGEDVALVSDAGTPTVSDPGRELIRAALNAGARVEAVPGPSAVTTALAASGLPADQFSFMGFPPVKGSARRDWLDRLRSTRHTVVFFEAPHRITRTLTDLRNCVGDCYVVVGREMTKAHEEWARGPISSLLEAGLKERGEFTVVLNVGYTTENFGCSTECGQSTPTDQDIRAEFDRLAEAAVGSRRDIIGRLAELFGLPSRDVYASLERTKLFSGD